jgi:hypothetical protein
VTLFERIRDAAATVAARARFVRVETERLEALAGALAGPAAEPARLDPAHHHLSTPAATLAYVVTLDAVNFGSGWFPHLRKRPGCSGYFTIASALKERFESGGALSADELRRIDARGCAALFGQDLAVEEQAELMGLFATALRDLGDLLASRYAGRFAHLSEAAGASAERLVGLLAEMPFYRDVARYGALEVPFYKRAQLTAADLAAAFGDRGPGRFDDLDALTIFADNLVPHVLRREEVLAYEAELAARIDRGELVPAGSAEEVEIRAVALYAVEEMVRMLRARGQRVSARRLDYLLWNRGQSPAMKAHPRHRTRTVYY